MNLSMIYCGGTVGCAGEPLKPLPAKDFQDLWQRHVAPGMDPELTLDWHWLEPALESCDMVPGDWGRLARMILETEGSDAVVLLHGTDTMAWSAAALAYLLTKIDQQGQPVGRFGSPVVLTGSQRPLFEGDAIRPGTDALDNLSTAISACKTGRTEVMLAFGGIILRGPRVMKVSTIDDRAFVYPKGGAPCPVVPAVGSEVLIEQLDRLETHLGKRAVVTLTPTPAGAEFMRMQTEAIIDSLGDKLGAIYLNCFGMGNFPARESIAPILQAAHDRGVLLAIGSQVPEGDVPPSAYGAGQWLTDCGAIPIADMTAAAAQAKLYVALALGAANGWQLADMERFFLTPVAGELRT